MNNLLQLKGTFEQKGNNGRVGPPQLPANAVLKVEHLEKLKADLNKLITFWEKENIFTGALISVYYNKVAAKSNRIKELLSKGKNKANTSIVGARFTDKTNPKHIITHYVQIDVVQESIMRLNKCIKIMNEQFDGVMTTEINKKINSKKIDFKSTELAKTVFLQVLVDCYFVEKFDIYIDSDEFNENAIITIFKTGNNTTELLEKVGINLSHASIIDDTTILLQPDDLILLKQKAPYLISMAVSDLSELDRTCFDFNDNNILSIPKPKNEPTVGVIDTLFDESVYFSEWVEYHDMVSHDIQKRQEDYTHGTAVSSIIVDGPSINPGMDDGCGRFKVRHFGVATGGKFSSFSILRQIDAIVRKNRDIKVWNLSLGSKLEVNKNFISPEAAILDKIQYENDVIFVIAGTNKGVDNKNNMRIGAPADSINSLVINSVSFDNKPTDYSRSGPVLSFFTKPDISYYGGDKNSPLRVCTPIGEGFVTGTSFAAPWITRKMSYLIDILGLSREVAKALIIHSSTGWDKQDTASTLIGHGVAPLKIEEVVKSKEDEIQFILSGISEKYNTYNYNIPVPINKGMHPFIAKATLCYFPYCSRNQGVDYTNTELDISFGRITEKGIKSINNNYQSDDAECFIYEEEARKSFRKWDNIKHIREVANKNKDKKVYDKGIWGVSLKTKERLDEKYGKGIKFGIVVTLKEIHGVNRIDEFINQCLLRGWLVNKIELENRIDIYNKAEETVEFDDLF